MKYRLLITIYLTLTLLVSGCFAQPKQSVVENAHSTTHQTTQSVKAGGKAKCSATSIGKHALLTASHCEMPTDKIVVDEYRMVIVKILRDDNDHTIYLLKRADEVDYEFHTAEFAQEKPKQGNEVFIFGNPSGFSDLFRVGYLSGFEDRGGFFEEPLICSLYDMNGYRGDSGSAVFNMKGQIVDVISQMTWNDKDGDAPFKLMVSLPLAFTPEQLEEARKF